MDARSLPFTVACSCSDEGFITPRLTEDKLTSEPIKPQMPGAKEDSTEDSKDDTEEESEETSKTGEQQSSSSTNRTYTPPPETHVPPSEPATVGVDPTTVQPVDTPTTRGGDDYEFVSIGGQPPVDVPSTERDEDIVSNVITPGEAQDSSLGALKVEIIRQY